MFSNNDLHISLRERMRKRKAQFIADLKLQTWHSEQTKPDQVRHCDPFGLRFRYIGFRLTGYVVQLSADEPRCWGCPVHWPGSSQCTIIVRVVFAALIRWRSVGRNHADKEVSLRGIHSGSDVVQSELFNKRHTHVLFCRYLAPVSLLTVCGTAPTLSGFKADIVSF